MLSIALIIALLVLTIYYTMQPGEIFARLGDWLERTLPKPIHSAVFACNVCMTAWYGTPLYWLIWGNSWVEWIVCVAAAMGFNIVINKWTPNKDD